MRFLFVFIVSMIMSVSAMAEYTLAVFGDSLSAGHKLPKQDAFYVQLEDALRRKGYDIRVLNVSKSGETTFGGLRKINGLLSKKPDGVILELGVNDSFRNTPVKTITENLKKMIDTFQSRQIEVLLVGMKTIPNKPIAYQQQFEEMYRGLADEYGLELYPFFMEGIFDGTQVFNTRIQNDNLLPNDFHPSAKGIVVMVQGILPTVEQFLNRQGVLPK